MPETRERSALEGATLYRRRCGWCGAYEGTVDPKEPCATDEIGYIGPHQFEVLEAVVSGSGTPPGEGEAIPGRFTAAEGRALRIAANVLANYEFKMLPLQLRKAADKIDAARRGEGGGE